jgi:hypothetical protein
MLSQEGQLIVSGRQCGRLNEEVLYGRKEMIHIILARYGGILKREVVSYR